MKDRSETMTVAEIDQELDEIRLTITPLQQRKRQLELKKAELLSREYIATNRITVKMVEPSTNGDRPFFNHIMGLARWLAKRGVYRPYLEWNGYLYLTSEVIAGRIDPDPPGRIEDVPGYRTGGGSSDD